MEFVRFVMGAPSFEAVACQSIARREEFGKVFLVWALFSFRPLLPLGMMHAASNGNRAAAGAAVRFQFAFTDESQ
jgi:hypothetical protein